MTPASYAEIEHKVLKLTNLEKVLYPASGFTKAEVISYYRKIGPTILPHLHDRPVTLRRFPAGVEGESFYEKRCPAHHPGWIRTGEFQGVGFCLINDLRTLIWVANLATIELHTTLAKIQRMECPDGVVFDLDPGEGTGFQECAQIALQLAQTLKKWNLTSYPKTSGGKGLHIYVPLHGPLTYEVTKGFARSCAELLSHRFPDQVTSVMSKKVRQGKIFIDWSQNIDFKSTVCAYSLRAGSHPTVSTPITWTEVRAASVRSSVATELIQLTPKNILRRLQKTGDLFKPVLELRQGVPAAWSQNLRYAK